MRAESVSAPGWPSRPQPNRHHPPKDAVHPLPHRCPHTHLLRAAPHPPASFPGAHWTQSPRCCSRFPPPGAGLRTRITQPERDSLGPAGDPSGVRVKDPQCPPSRPGDTPNPIPADFTLPLTRLTPLTSTRDPQNIHLPQLHGAPQVLETVILFCPTHLPVPGPLFLYFSSATLYTLR